MECEHIFSGNRLFTIPYFFVIVEIIFFDQTVLLLSWFEITVRQAQPGESVKSTQSVRLFNPGFSDPCPHVLKQFMTQLAN